MRILQIVPSLALETGGPSTSVPAIARAFADEGHSVSIFTSDWPPDSRHRPALGTSLAPGDFWLTVFPARNSRLMPDLPHSPELVYQVREGWQEFDMVIVHSMWNPIASFSMRALRRAGCPYCLMPHGMLDPVVFGRHSWSKKGWALLWERENVEHAEFIICNTRTSLEKARRSGWRIRRSFIFPHIIDVDHWRSLPARSVFENRYPAVKGRQVILFVGRIDWVKNLEILLGALAILRPSHPSAMLVCVGPDSNGHQAELERRAHELGIGDCLLFTGLLQGDLLKAAHARGDTFVLVSKKENFGMVAAEALASGLPVVLSTGVDLAHELPAGGPVLRVEPEPAEIAAALRSMLERSVRRGLPDGEALALAGRVFGKAPVSEFIHAVHST